MKHTMIHNPIIWADVPDVDVIRVKDCYYMVSTSMHTMPGCPIMRSKDLAHWEIVNYVFDTLEDNDGHNLLDNQGIYGKGSWAATLKHHDGIFYVGFSSNDMNRFYLFKTDDIEHGPWKKVTVIEPLLYDPALLFDGDTPYVICGNGDVKIIELEKDLSGIKNLGINQEIIHTPIEGIGLRCEGGHAYKIHGMYYIIYIEWPTTGNKRRRQVCYRSKDLLGPYERKIIFDDDMGYFNNGIAQGGIFDSEDGTWYALLFQDHGAVGRIPYILPVHWEDDWPMIGENGKAPVEFRVPMEEVLTKPLVISDEFHYAENRLALQWQWNHNPDKTLWSFTERPGYLRLTTGYITDKGVLYARNTLTQRTEGPTCTGITHIELSQMKNGDCAGLLALQSTFGMIGVRKGKDGTKRVVMCVNRGDYQEEEVESIVYDNDDIYFKITFQFENNIDLAACYYSLDGVAWNKIGCDIQMKYLLDHFMGYRIGLFYYATMETGGFVDFEYFKYDKNENI
ncbi:MAG: glycoside hydrolase [Anaerocolumna sp.]|nr:glycoside hydrolase [Anaerocolumna sp.]